MFNRITTYIKTHIDPNLKTPLLMGKPHILLGLSGGPDSVFLLYFLKRLVDENLIKLTAAHLNHGWRKEAHQDEQFCKTVCEKLKIDLVTEHAKNLTNPIKSNGSLEAIGRSMRQEFYAKTKKQYNADYIALAHHIDDQQETFFIRLIRGCSLAGLTGIKPVQLVQKYSLTLIRPLLATPKEKIVAYLKKNKISYITDASNKSDNFLRNRIRNHVIPACKGVDSRFSQTFEQTLATLSQENDLLQEICKNAFDKIFKKKENEKLVGDKKNFLTLHPIIQKRLILSWLTHARAPFTPSTRFFDEIVRFLSGEHGGNHEISNEWLIKKQKNQFWIETRKMY